MKNNLEGKKTIMGIGGHPADVVDLAGGTIYNHVQQGDRAIIVNMTHGAYSHAALLYDEFKGKYATEEELYQAIVEEKSYEAVEAAKCLGVTQTINLGYDDEPLQETVDRVRTMAEMIREFKPDIVITHHPNEFTHEDHSVCGWIVVKALKAAVKFYPGSKFEQHFVPAVYFFGIQLLSKQGRLGYQCLPHDVLVDIESAVEPKIKALSAIRSQKNTEKSARDRLNSLERENGRLDGLLYSESFISFYPYKTQLLPANIKSSWYQLQEKMME